MAANAGGSLPPDYGTGPAPAQEPAQGKRRAKTRHLQAASPHSSEGSDCEDRDSLPGQPRSPSPRSLGPSDREEGELSDHEPDHAQESDRLFQLDQFSSLLAKAIKAMGYNNPGPAQTTQQQSKELSDRALALFKRSRAQGKLMPFPSLLFDVVKEEWGRTSQQKKGTFTANKIYCHEQEIMDQLKVPAVDEPVVSLVSGSLAPKPGEASLKEPDERRIDAALKRAHEASALSIRASASGAFIARAALMWAEDLLQDITLDDKQAKIVSLIRQANQFLADSSMDSMRFSARSITNTTVARRSTWLKHWQVDAQARATVSSKPFGGTLLFGDEALKGILVETKDKKLAMPSTRRPDKRPFRPSTQPQSFRASRSTYAQRDFRQPRPQWPKPRYAPKAYTPQTGGGPRKPGQPLAKRGEKQF